MSAEYTIIIDKEGKMKIQDIKGVEGKGCTTLTEGLKKIGKLVKETKTADYDKSGPDVSINAQLSK